MRLLSGKVLATFVKKEFRQILRTKEMRAILFAMPVIQLLVMGFAVTNEVKHVKLVIEDRDKSTLSQQLSNSFTHTDRFDVIPNPTAVSAQELIINWKTQLVIIIPPSFAKDITLNRKPAVQIISDGLDGNTAAVAVNYANGIIAQFIQSKVMNTDKLPQTTQVLAQIPPQISVEDRMWYNQDMDSAQYMIPGIIAILLTVTSMMLSAMSLVKEKEIGTLEQLMVTPVTKTELLLGKLIPYWLLSLFEISLVTYMGHIIFGIHFSGSIVHMSIMTAVFLLTTLGLGIFVSTVTQTQQQAMFFAWFVMVFMILLSGLFVPIQNMPVSVRYLTLLNPMSYFLNITREIIIKGTGIIYLWKDCLALLIYGVSIILISVTKFHKQA